jgi:hypothetical protein
MRVIMPPRSVVLTASLAVGLSVALTACGSSRSTKTRDAGALRSYLGGVEPIRLAVNQLLEKADPILAGYHDHKLSGSKAAQAMSDLERRFANYTDAIAAIRPSDAALAGINATYAHTYVLEDAYLSALVAALPGGVFDDLPNTQNEQRAAIIEWRTEVHVLARQAGVRLPADLEQAGRGEIAPSPTGS